MICDICGKDTALKKQVTRSFGKKKNLLIIEDIPVVSCPACGVLAASKSVALDEMVAAIRSRCSKNIDNLND